MKRQEKSQSIYAVDREKPDSMTEQLVENVKGAILGGVLKEGDRLPSQKELSVLSGACEMVVREALRRLSDSGYVVTRPRVGCVVRKQGRPVWCGNVVIVTPDMNDNFFLSTTVGILRSQLIAVGYFVTQVFVCVKCGDLDFSQVDTVLQRPTALVIALSCQREVIRHLAAVPAKKVFVGGEYDANVGDDLFFDYDGMKAILKFVKACKRHKVRRAIVASMLNGNKDMALALNSAGIETERWTFRSAGGCYPSEAVESVVVAEASRRLAGGRDWLPDLIYCCDDFVARGLITAFGYHGIRIPEDVKLVTWSNKGNGPWYVKPLARIELDPDEFGNALADRAIRVLAGRKQHNETIAETHFVDEESFFG